MLYFITIVMNFVQFDNLIVHPRHAGQSVINQ